MIVKILIIIFVAFYALHVLRGFVHAMCAVLLVIGKITCQLVSPSLASMHPLIIIIFRKIVSTWREDLPITWSLLILDFYNVDQYTHTLRAELRIIIIGNCHVLIYILHYYCYYYYNYYYHVYKMEGWEGVREEVGADIIIIPYMVMVDITNSHCCDRAVYILWNTVSLEN